VISKQTTLYLLGKSKIPLNQTLIDQDQNKPANCVINYVYGAPVYLWINIKLLYIV